LFETVKPEQAARLLLPRTSIQFIER
jgi:hypothetical protein